MDVVSANGKSRLEVRLGPEGDVVLNMPLDEDPRSTSVGIAWGSEEEPEEGEEVDGWVTQLGIHLHDRSSPLTVAVPVEGKVAVPISLGANADDSQPLKDASNVLKPPAQGRKPDKKKSKGSKAQTGTKPQQATAQGTEAGACVILWQDGSVGTRATVYILPLAAYFVRLNVTTRTAIALAAQWKHCPFRW